MRLSLPLLFLVLAAPAAAQEVECSGRGERFEERGTEACLCESGYSAVGLTCVEAEAGDALVLRARHQPGVGERVASIAEAQVGHRRHQVTHDGDALRDYLAPDEWWCGDFVAWVYARAGVPFDGGAMGGWLVTNNHAIGRWFDARGLWVPRRSDAMQTFEPRPGDFVRFPTERGGHAAIVVQVRGTTLYTVEGNVGGAVERARYFHFRDNPLIAGFGRLALDNAPPEVHAEAPLEVAIGEPIELGGEVTDDGPLDALIVDWSAPSPGVALRHRTRPDAIATFERAGTFELTLAADDGEHRATATVTVTARRDDPPTLVLEASDTGPLFARLDAQVEDEGEPTLAWRAISGPAEVELSSPDADSTDAHFTEPGRYVLALRADDGVHVSERRLTLDVQAGGFGCAASPGRAGSPWLLLALAVWKLRRRRS